LTSALRGDLAGNLVESYAPGDPKWNPQAAIFDIAV
jgi:hypothetical protein